MVRRATLGTFVVLVLLSGGCGDKRISLGFEAPAAVPALQNAQPITVYAFRDRRGSEGDEGDPLRVGGIYGGYGNRLSKVMADAPFMPMLVNALVAGFKVRGVPVQARLDRPYEPAQASTRGYALSGDLKNFSTEARFTNSAHISTIIRLYNPSGAVVVEKEVSERVRSDYGGGGVFTDVSDLQRIMNDALRKFVERVVTDPDISARLTER